MVVQFDLTPTVHYMYTWSYAYKTARQGEWEQMARDRERFKLRIERSRYIIEPVLIKKINLINK